MNYLFDYRDFLGVLAIIISFGSYVPYFKGILSNIIKPHAFSWFIWGLLTSIAFAIQIAEKGGIGAWVTLATAITCFAVFFLALTRGEKDFSRFDWVALAVSLFAIALWIFTNDPFYSILLVTGIDIIGFLPTFRKGFIKPYEESAALYSWSTLKYILGILALDVITVETAIFPAIIALLSGIFVIMLLVRRKALCCFNF